MPENLPYSTAPGTLEKMLEKVKTASVPERFTQDFVATKLAMNGGTAQACIPFMKKMGLVGSDGAPTDLYRGFRNPDPIAHCSFLAEDEKLRLELSLRDWFRLAE